jgi:hypothetical protein
MPHVAWAFDSIMHWDDTSHATVGIAVGAGVIVTFGTLPESTGAAHATQTNMPIIIRTQKIPREIVIGPITSGKNFLIINIPPSRYPEIEGRGWGSLIKICDLEMQPDLHGA